MLFHIFIYICMADYQLFQKLIDDEYISKH